MDFVKILLNCIAMEKTNVSYATREQEVTAEVSSAQGVKCPHCGSAVSPDSEICPSCGGRLVQWCTFCGAPMLFSEDECPECGAPASGVRCPSCGTLSQRPFCPSCGGPVTRAAQRMAEAAAQDPLCVAAAERSEEVADLQKELASAPPSEVPRIKHKIVKVTEDLNSILAGMLPPAGSTPQEQRNYYSARKVAVETRVVTRVRVGWVCNYCGCTHDNPSECCKPFLGGKWVYEDKVDVKIDYRK